MSPKRPILFPPDDELDEAMLEVLRAKSGAERLQMAFDMFDAAREMLTHNLRRQHPEWDAEQVQREVARRISHGDV